MCELTEERAERIRDWIAQGEPVERLSDRGEVLYVGHDEDDEFAIIVWNWDTIAKLNFAINAEFNPNWPEQREVYLRAIWLYRQVRDDSFITSLRGMKLHYADPRSGVYGERLLKWDPRCQRESRSGCGWPRRMPARLHGVILLDDVARVYFEDEAAWCHECGRVIYTQPTSYGWKPDYHEFWDDGLICGDCIRDDEELTLNYLFEKTYFADLDGAAVAHGGVVSVNTYIANPYEHGWVRANDDSFRTGMRRGDTDDPRAMIKVMNKAGIHVMFDVCPEQFGADFWLLVQEKDLERVHEVMTEHGTKLDYDPAAEMDKVLRGEHSDHITKETYLVNQDDLVDSDNWMETAKEKGKRIE